MAAASIPRCRLAAADGKDAGLLLTRTAAACRLLAPIKLVLTTRIAARAVHNILRPFACRSQSAYHIVNRATIGEVKELAEPRPEPAEGASELEDLPDVNREMITKREERALAKAQADAANINERVTMRDQAIFDAIRKTMPCEWMEGPGEKGAKVQCMFVMQAVRCLHTARAASAARCERARWLWLGHGVTACRTRCALLAATRQVMVFPPYAPESVKGKGGEEVLTERVKKILGGIVAKVDAEGGAR